MWSWILEKIVNMLPSMRKVIQHPNQIITALDSSSKRRESEEYVLNNFGISDGFCNKYKLIISKFYSTQVDFIHFQPSREDNSNGITIPISLQSSNYLTESKLYDDYDKTVILINSKKLESCTAIFSESVIVHELSHCYDFSYRFSKFQKRYRIGALSKIKRGSIENKLVQYFQAYSEARAKYLQEMFFIEKGGYKSLQNLIHKEDGCLNIDAIYDEDEGEEKNYKAQHIAGKIRCWEKLLTKGMLDEKSNCEVKTIKNYFWNDNNFSFLVKEMYDCWDWEMMLQKCDLLLQGVQL